MLWYKAWLETRLRILLLLTIILFVLVQIHWQHAAAPAMLRTLRGLGFLWAVNSMVLAGAGVRTDSPFRAMKGIQGSIYFTLSLPVSRLKLLAIRAALGLTAIAGVIIVAGVVGF